MTALVTGSKGFVGSALCRELRARGADVYGIEDETAKNNAAFRLQVDILERYLPAEVVETIDAATMGAIMEAYVSEEAEAGE